MKKALLLLLLAPSLCFGQWAQIGNSIVGETAGDYSGSSTAISADGSIVAMGAPRNAGNGNAAGQVRAFKNINGTWTQLGADIDGESSGDQTGRAVSLSADGTVLAIGEPFNDDQGFVTGQVRVFEYLNGVWTPRGADLYGQSLQAAAGNAVDLSQNGSVVAVGAPNTEVNGIPFAGNVRVFDYQNSNWVQKGTDIEGDGSIIKFGQSVSLSADGNIVAIGASGNPNPNGQMGDTGYVKIYQYFGGQWSQLGNKIQGFQASDEFGYKTSLSADGTILAVGSYGGLNEVHVYALSGGVWSPLGAPLTGEAAADAFGFSLSLSDDGTYLAVGARFNQSNGYRAGRAYVYHYQGGSWVLVNTAIDGVVAGDQAGFSVSLSANGAIVAVGGPQNDAIAMDAGHVRVFENTLFTNAADLETTHPLTAYPNPTAGAVWLRSPEEILSYDIFALDGRKIARQEADHQTEVQANLSAFAPGVYFVRINTATSSSTIHIIKD